MAYSTEDLTLICNRKYRHLPETMLLAYLLMCNFDFFMIIISVVTRVLHRVPETSSWLTLLKSRVVTCFRDWVFMSFLCPSVTARDEALGLLYRGFDFSL